MLIVGSFAVGNFGLSECLTEFRGIEWGVDRDSNPLGLPPTVLKAAEGVSATVDYTAAHVIMWISVLIALLCIWDSMKDGIRMGIETEAKEDIAPPTFKRLKHPPAPPQPKRHYKYRPA
jgi:hypothetical protein